MAQTEGTVAPVRGDESHAVGGDALTAEERFNTVSQYMKANRESPNTTLFSFLALLKHYIPESYLLMQECEQILGPPDPIHGGPPFEERMEPFTAFIDTSSQSPDHVCMIDPRHAERAVKLLADLRFSRSATVKKFIRSLGGGQPQPHITESIKGLLTKRKLGAKGKEKFSQLIEDILVKENPFNAVSVLKTASETFEQSPFFSQTISRLYYSRRGMIDYERAEKWARIAIERAPNNSYMADTFGQIYKNRLLREDGAPDHILEMTQKAFKAFEDVERKADQEVSPEMMDTAGIESISNVFNNRGLFGFIHVAKIAFEKLESHPSQQRRLIETQRMKVETTFKFFEWYLTYSKADKENLEPPYFWRDIVRCYEYYTTERAAASTSFPGLLDCLNHGLFTSKGLRAQLEEAVKTVSDLEAIQEDLKTAYETFVDDVNVSERYILSNIILSNKMQDSPHLAPVTELKGRILRFLSTEVGHRSSEFYLLVLLLFWPEEQSQMVKEEDDEEVQQRATNVDGSEETSEGPAQTPLELMLDLDLQQQVRFMEKVFERGDYAKYLRGRNLLPLFFLGKGTGLSKWIHKSRLDAIVEEKVDAELADGQDVTNKEKWRRIDEMWISGRVWQVPEIQGILLPVQVELDNILPLPQEHREQKVFVCAGGKKIEATAEFQLEASTQSPMLSYLGFTIKGPVVYKV